MKYLIVHQILLFLSLFCISSYSYQEVLKLNRNDFDKYILISTIDGNIHLLNWHTGARLWSQLLSPVTKTVGTNGSLLISNPINGKLFIFKNNQQHEVFTSLDKSLYEYVRQTPVFMDGLLMTGSKTDKWISLDVETGEFINSFQSGEHSHNCPFDSTTESNKTMIFIGVCQYNLVLSDPSSRKLIYSISLNSMSTHTTDYYNQTAEDNQLKLYAASDSGLIAAKFQLNGLAKAWTNLFNSSIIGFYRIMSNGILTKSHFISMSHETLGLMFLGNFPANSISLKKAMFFGQSPDHSWYVLSTYIQQKTYVRSLSRKLFPLITGPEQQNSTNYYDKSSPSADYDLVYKPSSGFYEEPVSSKTTDQYVIIPHQYLLDFDGKYLNTAVIPSNKDPFYYNRNIVNHDIQNTSINYNSSAKWFWFITASAAGTFIMTLAILLIQMRNYRRTKIAMSKFEYLDEVNSLVQNHMIRNISSSSNNSLTYLNSSEITVGELIYYPNEVLGYGTNGTVVFKGLFLGNHKEVAVKRLVKTEQSQYELQFLRQSFDCSYLIKCFYINESREFTFLALELCDCTMESYVADEKFRVESGLDQTQALFQMMSGVNFLHSKSIVHRDLKPRNVLLMRQQDVRLRQSPIQNKQLKSECSYKVVISDFGLSRQSLDNGSSITKTGYCAGTTGYMAPELMREDIKRITTSADIFSCGILFYYIQSLGHHPFGSDVLSRQHRIHRGIYELNPEQIQNEMMIYFIKCMLKPNPKDRPNSKEILEGPLFWKYEEKLSFICDISDYLEKADNIIQIQLDRLGALVFIHNWTETLDEEFLSLLAVQRTYKIRYLSHLVRALRNKRNHFHELPYELSKRLFNNSIAGLAQYLEEKYPRIIPVIYDWVKSDITIFPASILRYLPGVDIPNESPATIRNKSIYSQANNDMTKFDNDNEDNEGNSDFITNIDETLPEWRRQSKAVRRRPNQPKKCRGTKSSQKIKLDNS